MTNSRDPSCPPAGEGAGRSQQWLGFPGQRGSVKETYLHHSASLSALLMCLLLTSQLIEHVFKDTSNSLFFYVDDVNMLKNINYIRKRFKYT